MDCGVGVQRGEEALRRAQDCLEREAEVGLGLGLGSGGWGDGGWGDGAVTGSSELEWQVEAVEWCSEGMEGRVSEELRGRCLLLRAQALMKVRRMGAGGMGVEEEEEVRMVFVCCSGIGRMIATWR